MIDTFQELSEDSLIQQKLGEFWNTVTVNQEARSTQKHEDSQQSWGLWWSPDKSQNAENKRLQYV